jgi:ribonuclease HI
MVNMPIELYTDGSSLGNPGPSGYGYIIKYYETAGENEMPMSKEIEAKQGFKLSTNSRMEIMAGNKNKVSQFIW